MRWLFNDSDHSLMGLRFGEIPVEAVVQVVSFSWRFVFGLKR